DIDQMVRNPSPVGHGKLRSSDIEIPENLQGITIYDFAVEFLRDFQRKVAFSRASGANDRNQGLLRHVSRSRAIAPALVLFRCHRYFLDPCHETPLYNKKVIFGSNRGASWRSKESLNSMIRFAKAVLSVVPLSCMVSAQTPQPPAATTNAPDTNKAG